MVDLFGASGIRVGRRKRWAETEFPEMEQDRPCVAFTHPLPNCPSRVASDPDGAFCPTPLGIR